MQEKIKTEVEAYHGPLKREVLADTMLYKGGHTFEGSEPLYNGVEIGFEKSMVENGSITVIGEVGLHNDTEGLASDDNLEFAVVRLKRPGGDHYLLCGMEVDDSGRKQVNRTVLKLEEGHPVAFGRRGEGPADQSNGVHSASELWPGRNFLESQGFSREHVFVVLKDGKVEVKDNSTIGTSVKSGEARPAIEEGASEKEPKKTQFIESLMNSEVLSDIESLESSLRGQIDRMITTTREIEGSSVAVVDSSVSGISKSRNADPRYTNATYFNDEIYDIRSRMAGIESGTDISPEEIDNVFDSLTSQLEQTMGELSEALQHEDDESYRVAELSSMILTSVPKLRVAAANTITAKNEAIESVQTVMGRLEHDVLSAGIDTGTLDQTADIFIMVRGQADMLREECRNENSELAVFESQLTEFLQILKKYK